VTPPLSLLFFDRIRGALTTTSSNVQISMRRGGCNALYGECHLALTAYFHLITGCLRSSTETSGADFRPPASDSDLPIDNSVINRPDPQYQHHYPTTAAYPHRPADNYYVGATHGQRRDHKGSLCEYDRLSVSVASPASRLGLSVFCLMRNFSFYRRPHRSTTLMRPIHRVK